MFRYYITFLPPYTRYLPKGITGVLLWYIDQLVKTEPLIKNISQYNLYDLSCEILTESLLDLDKFKKKFAFSVSTISPMF